MWRELNLFSRVAIELDGGVAHGDAWHRRLLQQMAVGNEVRPPFISPEVMEQLQPYLQFRHFFRHSYSFQLRWDKLAPLVLQYEKTFSVFREALATFSASMEDLHS